jgi:hypothetical protein
MTSRSSSDRRCRKNKRLRFQNTCTVCGIDLPKNRKRWGLVWGDLESGMCRGCLMKIRGLIGYYKWAKVCSELDEDSD